MNIYMLENWKGYDYAGIAHRGTWSKSTGICPNCGQHGQHLIEPLQIEWEPGSDMIGDFSWCGFTFAVKENAKQFFIQNRFECNFGKVEIQKLSTKRRGRKIVPFPYKGPKIHWVMPYKHINLDNEKSALEIKSDCKVCNRLVYKFQLDGLLIPKSEWHGEKMFNITQYGDTPTYISEDALQEILSQDFTNFNYSKAGIIE